MEQVGDKVWGRGGGVGFLGKCSPSSISNLIPSFSHRKTHTLGKSRNCSTMPHRRKPKKPTFLYLPSTFTILIFILIIAPPMLAIFLPPHPIIASYGLTINIFTFMLYRHDKAQSRIAGWRVTERRLHLSELLGGWPAAFIAQRLFQHKTRKTSYQIEYWAIVFAHEALWIDWMSHGALRRLVMGRGLRT